ncbi:MAG: uncharacterized protein V7603_1015 [Micromonosporaceae bacterium]
MDPGRNGVATSLPHGPTVPTDGAVVALRPLRPAEVRIEGGFWADRQRVNRDVTIAAAAGRLAEAGNFHNLRLAAGSAEGAFAGRLFADSEVYKWLEALAWEQAREPSARMAEWQAAATALVAAAQAPDGYLNSYFQTGDRTGARYSDLPFGHELFCAGHLIQAGVAQCRGTGRDELLRVAIRCADHLVATFGPGRRQGVCGHPEVEMALVELYRLTGRGDYLDLAAYFIDARGHGLLGPGLFGDAYYQDRVPVREARAVEGHAVRAVFLAAGATDVSIETGDRALLEAVTAQWAEMVRGKTYLTGGIGARWEGECFGDPYELPPDAAYCETCAAHGSVLWSWRLLLATGEARYADLIERTLFNAFAAGLSLDGRTFFYANPLQLRREGHHSSSRSARRGRRPWFGTACCPPNVMRALASLDHYVATRDADGIQLHQYATGTVRAAFDGGAELSVTTDYPWDGRITVAVRAAPRRPWTLSFRVPAWCDTATASVNGTHVGTGCRPGAYLRLRRDWRPGDLIVLDLPMPARRTVADERVDAVRGCQAIERGPLVYCVEQADLPAGVSAEDVRLDRGDIATRWRPDLLGGVRVADAPGRAQPEPGFGGGEHAPRATGRAQPEPGSGGGELAPRDGLPYRRAGTGARRERPIRLTAIPYYAWANRELGPMRVWIPTVDGDR